MKPPDRENIVAASVMLNGHTEYTFYLRTFEGPDPIEMDSFPLEERRQHYESFMDKVNGTISDEFQVTPEQLKEGLEKLALGE